MRGRHPRRVDRPPPAWTCRVCRTWKETRGHQWPAAPETSGLSHRVEASDRQRPEHDPARTEEAHRSCPRLRTLSRRRAPSQRTTLPSETRTTSTHLCSHQPQSALGSLAEASHCSCLLTTPHRLLSLATSDLPLPPRNSSISMRRQRTFFRAARGAWISRAPRLVCTTPPSPTRGRPTLLPPLAPGP
jgi:hypothetical protein